MKQTKRYRTSITVDPVLIIELKKYLKENGLRISGWVDVMMRKTLKK